MADGEIKVELSIEEQQALRALTTLTKKFENFGKDAGDSIKKGERAWSSFVGNLGAMAVQKGLGLVADGIGYVGSKLVDAVKDAAEAQAVFNSFQLALAQTGTYSQATADKFGKLSDEIESMTGIAGEAVLTAATFIQQLNKLSSEGLEKATRATVDFAAAMNMDVETASRMVGKAIDGNAASFKKFGISVEEGSTKTERLNNVLEALAQFNGSAEAKTRTFAGALQVMEANIGNMWKELGKVATGNPAFIASINGVSKAFAWLTEMIEKNKEGITRFITEAVLKLVDGIGLAADVFVFFNKGITGTQLVVSLVEQSFWKFNQVVSEMQKTVSEATLSFMKMAGLDEPQFLKDSIVNSKLYVDTSKAMIGQIDQEINAIMSRTNAQNNAANGFVKIITDTTKEAIAQQHQAQTAGTQSFLTDLNAKAEAQISKESETITALALLRDTKSALDLQKDSENNLMKQLMAEENYLFLESGLGREEALREIARAEELAKTAGHNAAKLQLQAAFVKAQQGQVFTFQKWEDLSQKQRLDNFKSTMGTLSTLQNSSSKELFMVGKASAIAMATIDGFAAVQKAMASAPPPYNFALAALVGVATAANIGKIASAQPPKFENGGIVGGNSFTGDKVSASVNSGEMILNRQQQISMFKQINGGASNNSSIADAVRAVVAEMRMQPIVVQANGREIARLVRDENRSGFGVV